MRSTFQIARTWVAVTSLLLMSVGAARAQQGVGNGPIGPIAPIQSRQMPVPAARSGDINVDPAQIRPDTHTLSSIEGLGIGSLGALTSFVDPSFRFTQSGDNGTASTWNGLSSLGMNLAFDHSSIRSRLSGFYSGAKVIYFPNSLFNASYHNLGVAEELRLGRWNFRLREDLMSSPEAAVGGGTGNLILSSSANLQPLAGEADTILTQRAKRLSSTTSGEINYYFSRRSILTTTGSYTSLTFPDAGFIDTHQIAARVGYDYLLSPRNSIGLLYDYNRMDFSATTPNLRTDSVKTAFGHKVTGRLAFQVSAGPQQIQYGTGGRQLGWTLSNNLMYQTHRTQYSLMYTHAIAPGSGVLTGVSTHRIGGSVHYALTQWWSASTTGGYDFNETLAQTSGISNNFGVWHGTASLERNFGRHIHFALNYGLQNQNIDIGACPVTGCDTTALHQTVGMNLEWHPFMNGAR